MLGVFLSAREYESHLPTQLKGYYQGQLRWTAKLNSRALSRILQIELRELNHICVPNRGEFWNIAHIVILLLAVFSLAPRRVFADKAQTAVDLSGTAIDPLTHITNKAVVLIFVSSECPISNRYAPEISTTAL